VAECLTQNFALPNCRQQRTALEPTTAAQPWRREPLLMPKAVDSVFCCRWSKPWKQNCRLGVPGSFRGQVTEIYDVGSALIGQRIPLLSRHPDGQCPRGRRVSCAYLQGRQRWLTDEQSARDVEQWQDKAIRRILVAPTNRLNRPHDDVFRANVVCRGG
jgi:hypothetical protein